MFESRVGTFGDRAFVRIVEVPMLDEHDVQKRLCIRYNSPLVLGKMLNERRYG